MKKQQQAPQPKKRSRKSIILISLAVVLTACCGLSALASLLGGGDTARTDPTPVVETASQLERQVQEVSALTADTSLSPVRPHFFLQPILRRSIPPRDDNARLLRARFDMRPCTDYQLAYG